MCLALYVGKMLVNLSEYFKLFIRVLLPSTDQVMKRLDASAGGLPIKVNANWP